MIRATMQIIRAIHKYKDEFPILFSEFEREKKRYKDEARKSGYKRKLKGDWLFVSDEAKQEYLSLVEKYLKVKKLPSNNRKVWITTSGGGKHVGFYEDGKWWYNVSSDKKVEEKYTVIRWQKYDGSW